MFRGLVAGRGAEAVGTVRTFLDRFVALRDGTDPEREHTRSKDREAAELIAARRIVTPEKEHQLRQLIEIAERLAPEAPEPAPEYDEEYLAVAHQFHAWIIGWRAHARALTTRGDYLLQLGIGTRSDSDEAEADNAEAVGKS